MGFGVILFVYVLIRLRVHKVSIEGYATVTLHRDNEMTKITVSMRSEVAVSLPLSGCFEDGELVCDQSAQSDFGA